MTTLASSIASNLSCACAFPALKRSAQHVGGGKSRTGVTTTTLVPGSRHCRRRRRHLVLAATASSSSQQQQQQQQQQQHRRRRRQERGPEKLKIAVIGAGPCGLTTALALRHHGMHDVTVFDKYPEIRPALGAAFNLNGGAAVLDKLGLIHVFRDLANPMKIVRSRRVSGDRFQLMNIDIPRIIREDPSARASLVSATDGGELCGTVMRADLLRALADELPQDSLSLGREIADVVECKDGDGGGGGEGVRMLFADGGESETYDLVIGADGIRSKVREAMFGPYTAKYSGIRIIFGCTGEGDDVAANQARPPEEHGEMHQWFGDGCYTLVYTGGGEGNKQHNVAVCIADDDGGAARDENAAWKQLGKEKKKIGGGGGGGSAAGSGSSDDAAKEACMSAVAKYDMPPDVAAVVERCERFFDIGVHYHDTLDSWSTRSGRMALAGDSCHAMPPFLGQGANQSLQDSWCIAECLARVRFDETAESSGGVSGVEGESSYYSSVKEALDAYEAVRKPPTSSIMLSSRVIGFVETGYGPVGLLRDVAFTALGTVGVAGKIFLKNAVPVLE